MDVQDGERVVLVRKSKHVGEEAMRLIAKHARQRRK
jgi:hypothetical protein